MSTQLENKQRTLAQMLAANRLTKIASDQEIKHEEVTSQDNLGKEMTQEINSFVEGTVASTPAAANKSKDTVDTPPNCQDLNKSPEAALASTGTSIKTVDQDGNPSASPMQLGKSAADYKAELAYMLAAMNKKAAMEKQAAENFEANFRTGTEVMQKFASLTPTSTQDEINECAEELQKLASTNPMFQVCRDRILMEKLAADVEALADAQGISPDEAAAALDEAAAADPSIMEEAEDEANGEAVAELADAESATDDLMGGIEELAANASQATGQEVTPDDIEVTPEDEANAQAIMEEAAANGISPDEVLQMAAEELGGGGEAATAEEASAEAPASDDSEGKENGEGATKEASLKVAATPRAAYVQSLMNAKNQ